MNPQRSEFVSKVAKGSQNSRATARVSSSNPEAPLALLRRSTSSTTSESIMSIGDQPFYAGYACRCGPPP